MANLNKRVLYDHLTESAQNLSAMEMQQKLYLIAYFLQDPFFTSLIHPNQKVNCMFKIRISYSFGRRFYGMNDYCKFLFIALISACIIQCLTHPRFRPQQYIYIIILKIGIKRNQSLLTFLQPFLVAV